MEATKETPELIAARERAEQAKAAYEAAQIEARAIEQAARQAERQARIDAEKAERNGRLRILLADIKHHTANLVEDFPDFVFAYDDEAQFGTVGLRIETQDKQRTVVSIIAEPGRVTLHERSFGSYNEEQTNYPKRKDGTFNWTALVGKVSVHLAGVRLSMSAATRKADDEARFLTEAHDLLDAVALSFPNTNCRVTGHKSERSTKFSSARPCRVMLSTDAFHIVLTMVGDGSKRVVNVEANGNISADDLLPVLVVMGAQFHAENG